MLLLYIGNKAGAYKETALAARPNGAMTTNWKKS